jgi:hypothetical protein|tara:strand:- start:303 stop:467 length:165 start_codon:yes stop_codon:yes gene_type:complete
MIKVIAPIILFVLIVFGISHYWAKANAKNRKKIVFTVGFILALTFISTTYLLIE